MCIRDSLQEITPYTPCLAILSNHQPDGVVRCTCQIQNVPISLGRAIAFVSRLATLDTFRAVTHNKGIMNGVDAVIIATGNDFRAIEAGVHAYASKDGKYTSLTKISLINGMFKFWIELPLSVGTVGGITNLHPLVKWSLNLLNNPSAKQLMKIVAVSGLAQNFAAIQSLITTGIQKGHMKMHLINILNTLNANDKEKDLLINHFKKNTVSFSSVQDELVKLRKIGI